MSHTNRLETKREALPPIVRILLAMLLGFAVTLLLLFCHGCSLCHIPAYAPPNQPMWSHGEWRCPAGYELVDKWGNPVRLADKTDDREQDSWNRLTCKVK